MKKMASKALAVATSATVLGMGAVLAQPLAAHADPGSPTCMTKHEWSEIRNGMSRTRINQIVGNVGHTWDRTTQGDGWSTDVDVNYRQCLPNGQRAGSLSTVWIEFSNYKWDYPNNDRTPMQVSFKGSWSTPSRW